MENREIKFRAWDIESSEMIYTDKDKDRRDFFFSFSEGELNLLISVEDSYPEKREIHLMQFTCMFDKNNNLIYEGDIVQRNETGCEGSYISKYVVIFKENYFGLKIIQSHIFKKGAVIRNMDDCEIIGNIHENPELL
jgi:uncharacterized phage protein (TIGR01671 family)